MFVIVKVSPAIVVPTPVPPDIVKVSVVVFAAVVPVSAEKFSHKF